MFTNNVGCDLLILASNISAIAIDEGGAVKACKLIGTKVLSGSSETIRTV
jgi:hypothetical protein